jgi:hypothetical protein
LHFGRCVESFEREIVVFAKNATPSGIGFEHEQNIDVPSKREAATLGRTTDLRIIAETAIPRSTTELQQLIKHDLVKS